MLLNPGTAFSVPGPTVAPVEMPMCYLTMRKDGDMPDQLNNQPLQYCIFYTSNQSQLYAAKIVSEADNTSAVLRNEMK